MQKSNSYFVSLGRASRMVQAALLRNQEQRNETNDESGVPRAENHGVQDLIESTVTVLGDQDDLKSAFRLDRHLKRK